MAGWIADHRKEIESDVWLMPPMYHRVWQWLKYKVNHAPAKIPNKDGTFTTILPGQHATSYRLIAEGVGYYEGLKWKEPNVKTIKSILDWMVKNQMITLQGNTLGSIVTVAKWEEYQKIKDKGNAKETRKKHDLDTNNNGKQELNNEDIESSPKRKRFVPPTIDEVSEYVKEKGYTVNAQTFVDYNESKGWMVGKSKMKDWKAAVRTWQNRQQETSTRKVATDW